MWPLRKRNSVHEIAPDEIFLDSSNLPHLDAAQFEGRVERPVARGAILSVAAIFLLGVLVFLGRAFDLQVLDGNVYADISRENSLGRTVIFAERGIIYDRNDVPIAWNEALSEEVIVDGATSTVATTSPFALRAYTEFSGLAHILGFIRYPKQDAAGNWWREDYAGVSGLEFALDEQLRGENGSRIVETDARGKILRQHIVVPPQKGEDITLSIDAELQGKLSEVLSAHAAAHGFRGGASVIIDVETGEIVAMTSFPEYDNAAFSAGDAEAIQSANSDTRTPLLNRAISGLYAPGSIVKPIFAAAALAEGIIDPEKEILSEGQLVVSNPYDPSKPTIFRDWKAHGYTDMRRAIAVSSDVYFYTIGGGFGSQKGLGIALLDEWAQRFGLGSITGIPLIGEVAGVIPTPEWKAEVFDGDPWRLGDTYITAIGQFGFQITPIQAARYAAAIANGGTLPAPHFVKDEDRPLGFAFGDEGTSVGISDEYLQIVREGMRAGVTDGGTAAALNISGIAIGAKTGTAEVGERNQFMNSWVIGFWPFDSAQGKPASKPRYAFATVLERAPAGTNSGAAPGMRAFFEWLVANRPEYIR